MPGRALWSEAENALLASLKELNPHSTRRELAQLFVEQSKEEPQRTEQAVMGHLAEETRKTKTSARSNGDSPSSRRNTRRKTKSQSGDLVGVESGVTDDEDQLALDSTDKQKSESVTRTPLWKRSHSAVSSSASASPVRAPPAKRPPKAAPDKLSPEQLVADQRALIEMQREMIAMEKKYLDKEDQN